MDLTLPPALLAQTGAIYRRVAQLAAEAIQKDLHPWILQNARPDSARRADAIGKGHYPGDLASVLRDIEGKFSAAAIDAALAGVARAVDRNSFEKLARVPGVNPSRLISGGAGAVARFRQTNALLIESVPREMANDVGDFLASVDVRDLHVTDVGKILAERFSVSESRGEFWARDQTLKLYANVQETRQRAAGASRYQWETSEDERVRGRPGGLWAKNASDHWTLRNTIQLWSTPPVTNPKTGATNHPGHDYQCRCSAYPLFDGDEADAEPFDASGDVEALTPEEEAAHLRRITRETGPTPTFVPGLARSFVPTPRESEAVTRLAAGVDENSLAFLRTGYRDPINPYVGVTSQTTINQIATGVVPPLGSRNVLPPIHISVYESEGVVSLQDGRHRLEAAQRAGATEILALIREYDPDGNILRETLKVIPVPKADAFKKALLASRPV